ncbi:MAG: crcB [Myxococcales bacterium]|nr:crcB [Myxococcales bacterium]
MERVLIVFAAGGLGCVVRYLIGLWAAQRLDQAFPYGTLIVNVIGSFLIALVLELSLRIASFPPNLRLALTTGFMGGLTTYSSFNYETTTLATTGSSGKALINIAVTLVSCIFAGLAGLWVARRLTG